jgi:hypothetical protein
MTIEFEDHIRKGEYIGILEVARKFFGGWKILTLQKRTNKINKHVAKFHFKKRFLKKVIGAWKKYYSLKVFQKFFFLIFRVSTKSYPGIFTMNIREGLSIKVLKLSSNIRLGNSSKQKILSRYKTFCIDLFQA